MRNIKKVGLLIVLLASPALVFLYLVTFTTNHYDLPYFFPVQDESSGEYLMMGTDTVYYQVDRKVFSQKGGSQCRVSVISLLPEICDENCQRQIMNFNVVQEVINEFPQNCLNIYSMQDSQSYFADQQFAHLNLLDSQQRSQLVELLKLNTTEAKNTETVLLDENGHIRGFFRLSDNKDLDRLFAEIKILNHNLANND